MTAVCQTSNEAVRELANRTMHAAMHLGWVSHADGHHLQMAALVRTNGWFGRAYMAFIKLLRYWPVYPHSHDPGNALSGPRSLERCRSLLESW